MNSLRGRIDEFNPGLWMINTGWTGGPHGVGYRIRIPHTRAMLNAALAGDLDAAEYTEDPIFGLQVPTEIAGVPAELLIPRQTWRDQAAFDSQARRLAQMFRDNFKKYEATPEVVAAGPPG